MHFLIDLIFFLFKILYRICENACNKLCSFFVSEKHVHDEIVLITGAGHGIGRELAFQYARLGATVVCLDINQQMNENSSNEIAKTIGRPVYAYQCDVTDNARVREVAEKIKKEVGDITILINNAGIMPCYNFLNLTPDQITSQFNVNVLSHFWTIQAFLPGMIERNYGHIVAISSIAGLAGVPHLTAYSATKFAVKGFMESLEEELRISSNGKSLIKFTTIYPSIVNTGLCKKPKIKYPLFMGLISPKDAAAIIISAQRQKINERSIPSYWKPLVDTFKIFPKRICEDLRDFLDFGLEPEY
ncbi:short-chain dehydrogenase/reductase family 16C member 6-like [Odontomachus brunneus]|uniref:short-chain dehydrogenase/reductase family 16C member 6-like n=1 Tax=Odontomachus brunneus TaxID=486640 RepID=UPI0013F24097|nr:short-chain dehydrogenase/reductase family 16C member 6-like [Odontomachus brunneus]